MRSSGTPDSLVVRGFVMLLKLQCMSFGPFYLGASEDRSIFPQLRSIPYENITESK